METSIITVMMLICKDIINKKGALCKKETVLDLNKIFGGGKLDKKAILRYTTVIFGTRSPYLPLIRETIIYRCSR